MVDEHRLSAIKSDISGLAILKTFLWKLSFVILTLYWKTEIHFCQMCQTPVGFPQDFFLCCQIRWYKRSDHLRRKVLHGGRQKSAYFFNFVSNTKYKFVFIFEDIGKQEYYRTRKFCKLKDRLRQSIAQTEV